MRSSGAHRLPEAELERSEGPLDNGPPSVAAPKPPAVSPSLGHHAPPCHVSEGPGSHSVLQGDDRSTASVRDRLGNRSGLVALVERHIAQGKGRVELDEEGREGWRLVDVPGADQGGGEEGPSRPGHDEGVGRHETMTTARLGVPQVDPALAPMLTDTPGIAGRVGDGTSESIGRGLAEERLEVGKRHLLEELRDRRGGGNPAESQSMGELR